MEKGGKVPEEYLWKITHSNPFIVFLSIFSILLLSQTKRKSGIMLSKKNDQD